MWCIFKWRKLESSNFTLSFAVHISHVVAIHLLPLTRIFDKSKVLIIAMILDADTLVMELQLH